MPLLVQRMIDESFDEVMPTVRAKALRKADELVLLPVRERWRGKASKDPKATLRAQRARIAADLKAMAPWRRFRAVVLYKMIPHDKSFWRCIRSKSWWALNLIGVVPVAGPLWWLLVFVMKDTGECSQRHPVYWGAQPRGHGIDNQPYFALCSVSLAVQRMSTSLWTLL